MQMFQLVVATLPVLFLILGFSVYSIIADNSAYADATSSSTKREGRSSTTSSTSSSRGVVSPTATRPVDDAKLSSLDKIA
jgi:zona occludens toxin (predicted ATPase)